MAYTTVTFNHALEQAHDWLVELDEELGWRDEQKTFRALRAGLHALRDRLTVNEAVQLGAELPVLIRGYYYEGWKPAGKPLRERHLDEFLAHIHTQFQPDELIDAGLVARCVFNLLANRVSRGEIADVVHILPAEIRDLWPRGAPSGA